MLPEIRKIALVTAATVFVGALFGLLIGALTKNLFLWVGVWAAIGGAFGIALSYGFLPES